MASKRDIEIASLLFRSGILGQEDIQSALGHQGKLLTEGTVVSLIDVLVERDLIPADAAPSFTEEPLEKLQPLDDYELVEQVGDGASARVYRGVYSKRDLACAVKLLHPEQELQPKALKRFMREAHLLCRLRHPNIVQGYEVRKVNGFRFLSMEWFEGGTLLEEIDRRGGLDGPTALHITRQIASALAYLYSKGIVHRDIKPGNVLVDAECNAKLIDLGLCRLVAQQTDEAEGTTVGTVGYISPEQAKGVDDLDVRSDIYSLGVSLYHMVVGEVPFSGDDDFEADLFAVNSAAREAVARARDGGGPSLLHVKLNRYYGHFEGDAMTYRGEGEIERLREEKDSLKIFRSKVTEAGLLEASQLDEIDAEVSALIDAAVAEAEASPAPAAAELLTDVYISY